jgi:amino acid transporter
MALNNAGRPLSNGDLAVGCGFVLALLATFLPWQSTSLPNGYVCSDKAACGPGTVFQASHNAFGYWPGLIFFIAVLVGLTPFGIRRFVGQVTLRLFAFSDATIYAAIGMVMALCSVLWLIAGGGYTSYSSLGAFSSAPGFGALIAIAAAAVVLVGAFLLRSNPQPRGARALAR